MSRRSAPNPTTTIDVNAIARKIDVDNRIPIGSYYRIADNLLKQAEIFRNKKNIVELCIILLRYSSLVSETIPFHRDYQSLYSKERSSSLRKKLLSVLDELESLKPDLQQQIQSAQETIQTYELDGQERRQYGSTPSSMKQHVADNGASSNKNDWRVQQGCSASLSSEKQSISYNQFSSSKFTDNQVQKQYISLPLPKQETLSRHSFFGANGLHGQWSGPSTEIKVNYPTNTNLSSVEIESSSWIQVVENDILASRDGESELDKSATASVLSLDDENWSSQSDNFSIPFCDVNDNFPLVRQPSPPPVLAQVQPEYMPKSPSKVADSRPGPAKSLTDGTPSSDTYQHLHIPVKMFDDFLRFAEENTARNLETCGVLAGSLRNRVFHLTTLIIPKQESTSYSCQTYNEEEIVEVQDKLSLFSLGWIHTHPTQTCFMSSIDLHTSYSYQVMLPEAIAIVMAPTDTSSPHGIFHLSDPGGVSVIRNCQQRGFHPHKAPENGSPIYEHCSHVYMNPNLKFDVVDLR